MFFVHFAQKLFLQPAGERPLKSFLHSKNLYLNFSFKKHPEGCFFVLYSYKLHKIILCQPQRIGSAIRTEDLGEIGCGV